MLHTLPRRYLIPPDSRTMFQDMPKSSETIVMKNTAETRKAWRIASMLHSANVLQEGGLMEAATYLRVKSAALKHGVPDGCQSFADSESDPDIEVRHDD